MSGAWHDRSIDFWNRTGKPRAPPVAIGVSFLSRRTVRLAIALLALQMVGTFLPLFILPDVTFQPGRVPYGPTMEGQYIIKNLLIISAALVIGGTVRRSPP